MVAFPPCKINLGLHILSRRDDGYHAIETCFYPLPWTDMLEILPSPSLTFNQTGLNIPGIPEENFCLKAYLLVKKDFALPPVKIHLHKILPTGAGLGGGSSDAAHMLRLLNAVFELKLSAARLTAYATKLGSDCAFFTQDRPMLGRGRGEILEPTPVNLMGYYLVLVKPDLHVSTAEAYREVIPGLPMQALQSIVTNPVATWREELKNDFEETIIKRYPQIEVIKKTLYSMGAVYASMSGSGSTVFGIFENEIEVKQVFKDVLTWSGRL